LIRKKSLWDTKRGYQKKEKGGSEDYLAYPHKEKKNIRFPCSRGKLDQKSLPSRRGSEKEQETENAEGVRPGKSMFSGGVDQDVDELWSL